MNAIFVSTKEIQRNVSTCMFFYVQRIPPGPDSIRCLCEGRVTREEGSSFTVCNFEFRSKWIYYLFNTLFLKMQNVCYLGSEGIFTRKFANLSDLFSCSKLVICLLERNTQLPAMPCLRTRSSYNKAVRIACYFHLPSLRKQKWFFGIFGVMHWIVFPLRCICGNPIWTR